MQDAGGWLLFLIVLTADMNSPLCLLLPHAPPHQFFDGYGWFLGQVVEHTSTTTKQTNKNKRQQPQYYYRVEYEDEDVEECTEEELAPMVEEHSKFVASAPKKKETSAASAGRKQQEEEDIGDDDSSAPMILAQQPTVFIRYPIGTRICNVSFGRRTSAVVLGVCLILLLYLLVT